MAGIRDKDAAALLEELRIEAGLSPEELPHAMAKAGLDRPSIPSSRTIRRAEEGVVPQVRYRFALAKFYARPMASIWRPRTRRKVAA